MRLSTILAPLPCLLLAIAMAAPAGAKPHARHPIATPGAAGANGSDDVGATPPPAGPPPVPDSPTGDAAPPTLPDETAYVLMDGATGAILAEAAPTLQVAPASLTKLMTAHITYQALHGGSLKPDQTVTVTPDAWHAGGSRMFIDTTSVVNVDQLLHGLLIESGNDAAMALAEQIAGSPAAFTQIMNTDAAKLGLTDTVYANPTGLPDPSMHTTALDVARLTRAILADEPEILNITKQQSYTWDNITQASWNPVLAHDPTVDGLKTGLTNESGHCIDATAIRGGNRLIAVVMGGPTWHASTAAIESLLDYGEKFFTEAHLATAGQPIATLASPELDTGSVAVSVPHDIIVSAPTDGEKKIAVSIAYTADLSNGAKKGEVLGNATWTLAGKTVATSPLTALADAPPASFMTKLTRKMNKIL
jgi:D-alanyl-D-alanine carboxypeptidase (penicillin-binding protein 5/6)